MRMIVQFEKGLRLKHIGHLDLQRAMQRALRRSGLPVAYSQGFNPHMLLSFASPLPVGMAGKEELLDVTLEGPCELGTFARALSAALPPDLPLGAVRAVDLRHPKLMAQLRTASYAITLTQEQAAMAQAVDAFLALDAIPAIRVSKKGETPVDIRPMIHELSTTSEGLYARVSFMEVETLKPDLLIRSLAAFAGMDAPTVEICRLRLYGEQGGITKPLMDC